MRKIWNADRTFWLIAIVLVVLILAAIYYPLKFQQHRRFEKFFGQPYPSSAEKAKGEFRLVIARRLMAMKYDLADRRAQMTSLADKAKSLKADTPSGVITREDMYEECRALKLTCGQLDDDFYSACESARAAGFAGVADGCGCETRGGDLF